MSRDDRKIEDGNHEDEAREAREVAHEDEAADEVEDDEPRPEADAQEGDAMTNLRALQAADDRWIPCFKVGYAAGQQWTSADLDALVKNWKLLAGRFVAPITAGHLDRPILTGTSYNESSQPALGVVTDVKREGDRLLVRASKLPAHAKELARSGRFLGVSVEILPAVEKSTLARRIGAAADSAKGPALVGLAWLGAQRGEVQDLPSLTELYAASEDAGGVDETVLRVDFGQALVAGEYDRSASGAADRLRKRLIPKSLSLLERVSAAERQLTNMAASTQVAATKLAKMHEEDMTMKAFAATIGADDSESPLVERFRAEVEAKLAEHGWNRTAIDLRRKAGREVLIAWTHEPANDPAFPSLAAELTTEDFAHVTDGTTVVDRGQVGVAQKADTTPAAAPDKDPYSGAHVSSPKLSGQLGFSERMAAIAADKKLDLKRSRGDVRFAEALVRMQDGETLANATSFDSAVAAVMRTELGIAPVALRFDEHAEERTKAAAIVSERRPDLLPRYGSRAHVTHTPDPAELRFTEAVDAEMATLDVLMPEGQRRSLAVRRVLARDPKLAPRGYGWRS